MEKTSDGSILLNKEDITGVRFLLFAEIKRVVSIHSTTWDDINKFVREWERVTGDDLKIPKWNTEG